MRVFKIIGKAAVAFYEELFYYFLMGLVNMVAWILIIPGPFALTGIYAIGQSAVRGEGIKWGQIWDTIKEFGLRALLLFLTVFAGYGIVLVNIWFYNNPDVSPFSSTVAVWITPLWVVLGLLWTGITFYAQSFLMELKEPKYLVVIRNSFYLTVLHPLETLLWIIVIALLIGLSIVLPVLIIVTPGFISVLALTAVRTMVADLTERAEAMEAEEDNEEDEGKTTEEEAAIEEDEEENYEPLFFPLDDYEEEIAEETSSEAEIFSGRETGRDTSRDTDEDNESKDG